MIRQRLGKYRIVRWLGGGQFGDVYLAHDTMLDMDFALKVSRMRPSDIQMLRDEARLLAGLAHPNIVRFYSVDSVDDRFVLVTEYVEGQSLREKLEQGRMDIDESVEIIRQVLAALSYAFSRGVIHRDLKPENILLAGDGLLKVADFGLARFLREGSLAASVAGTPVYMSPESWQGRFLPSSDLWSVGVIFYEMLTGVLPFSGDSYEEIRKSLLQSKPTDPARLRPHIPQALTSVVLSLLTKDHRARPRDPEEVLKSLQVRGHRGVSLLAREKVSAQGISLTSEQLAITQSKANRLLLVGTAGSGKTTLLVHRALHLIEQGTSPDRLLCLAFSRRAAEEMRSRLERHLGRQLTDVWIETFHSLGWKFLHTEGWRLDLPVEFTTVNPTNLEVILAKKWGKNRTRALAEILSNLRREGRSLDDLPLDTPGDRQIAEFWVDYNEAKKSRDAVDFDDLVINTVELLESDEKLRDRWRTRFHHILIDELQDLNPLQFKLARLMCGPDTGLFAAGDAAQSIYTWRGADPRLIAASEKLFAPVERHELRSTFRMGSDLVKVAGNLWSGSVKAAGIPQLSLVPEAGHFEFYKAAGVADEARFVTERIRELSKNKGYRPSDFGILYRINSYSRAFEEKLASARIPYSVIGAQPFYEREEVRNLLTILTSIRKGSWASAIPAWQWLLSLKPETNPLEDKNGQLRLSDQAKTRSRRSISEFFSSITELSRRSEQASPADVIDFLASSKVTRRRFSSPALSQAAQGLAASAARFGSGELGLFLAHIALLEDLELAQWSQEAVKLLSVHSAKGLEFKTVFLTGLIEGLFPLTSSLADPHALEEELRLCYVAVTRSSSELYVTMPARRFRQPARPSRFLLSMLGLS